VIIVLAAPNDIYPLSPGQAPDLRIGADRIETPARVNLRWKRWT
jgi:hypothetical protein